jgi:transposase
MNEVSIVGLDIAKKVFQVHGVDAAGVVKVRRSFGATRGNDDRELSPAQNL